MSVASHRAPRRPTAAAPSELWPSSARPERHLVLRKALGQRRRLDRNSPLKCTWSIPTGRGRAGCGATAQSSLLWMNSMAQDVTMYTDETVICDGPIGPARPSRVGRQAGRPGLGPRAQRGGSSADRYHVPVPRVQSAISPRSTTRRRRLAPGLTLVNHTGQVVDLPSSGRPPGGHPRRRRLLPGRSGRPDARHLDLESDRSSAT